MSNMFVLQFVDGTKGPPRHLTTEGAVAATVFTSSVAADKFLQHEYYKNRVAIAELAPRDYMHWLRDAVDNFEVTQLFPDPDHVKDVGKYRFVPALPLLLALEAMVQ